MDSNETVSLIVPPEILEKIFSYLAMKDLLACSEVCLVWNRVADNKKLWRALVIENIGKGWLPHIESQEEKTSFSVTGYFDPVLDLNVQSHNDDDDDNNDSTPLLSSASVGSNNNTRLLSSLNPYKNIFLQRASLVHNWTSGVYNKYVLEPKKYGLTDFYRLRDLNYPSKAPQDCLYYPILGERYDKEKALLLIEIKEDPKIVCILSIFASSKKSYECVKRMCVMRNDVLWLTTNKVEYLSVTKQDTSTKKCGEPDSCASHCNKVITLKTWHHDKSKYHSYITIDNDYLAVSIGLSSYVWCKKTLILKFTCNLLDSGIRYKFPRLVTCFKDECMILCHNEPGTNVSVIEVFKIIDDKVEGELQMKRALDMDTGYFVADMECCANSIVIKASAGCLEGPPYSLVLELHSLEVSRSFHNVTSPFYFCEVGLQDLMMYDRSRFSFSCFNIPTKVFLERKLPGKQLLCHFSLLLENLAVIQTIESLEIWNWRKNAICHTIETDIGTRSRQINICTNKWFIIEKYEKIILYIGKI
ncbi:uncharacterized protein LOC111059919 [Nilaparvata lugens]|uniref:uncharacterized protein LOC111059919 n=1 Tax=Nilaparvata lugens TaxID=108931 RepID=UPI00193C997C|nr:uncharacterized protein LOC111059919 [Nilaparvata lugens]